METNKIVIPDGCKAEIRTENGQTVVIVESKGRNKGSKGNKGWEALFNAAYSCFYIYDFEIKGSSDEYRMFAAGNYFNSELACQSFCDDLNKAIIPIFDKAKKGEYDK